MKTDEFLEIFKELIQTDANLDLSTHLNDIEEWDSMAMMALVAWLDVEHGIKASVEQLQALETVGDLARLAPGFSDEI